MPKIVDHDQQRTMFAEATLRLVAREGLDGLTMRAVAAESGQSYGSLFHYFDSKDELLLYAIRHSAERQGRRVSEFSAKYKGLKALEQLLYDDAIMDDGSRDEWLVWLAFLYKAALQESFAQTHAELIDGWLSRIRGLLDEARERGEIGEETDTGFEALALWVFSAGIGQQSLLHPARFPQQTQKALISTYLDKLRK
jgi:AcrR family transcriptional regulator